MIKDSLLKITQNKQIAKDIFKLTLVGDIEKMDPGQFVNLKLENFSLRRPLSVYQSKDGELSLIYKIMGEGTLSLSKIGVGSFLRVLFPLGNGFDLNTGVREALIIGGGIGTVPLVYLCEGLIEKGVKLTVTLGFNTKEDIILKEQFEAMGVDLLVSTMDASFGEKGFVTDLIAEHKLEDTFFYCCGSTPMMKAVNSLMKARGQFSLEERMGCGFGVCMGCSIMTSSGAKRVCKEGPVFNREELLW